MRKKLVLIILSVCLMVFSQQIFAADLMQVYQQALKSDPVYKQAYADEMATAEEVPQSRAALLPQLSFMTDAGLNKTMTEASNLVVSGHSLGASSSTTRQRTLDSELSLTQSIFNYTNWQKLASSTKTVKAANATYNAAAQDLMFRTSQAYFNVLQSEDVLRYTKAEKAAYYQEYVRAEQSFRVGVKTITDVYNAKAAYDSSVAQYVIADNDVANKKEDLRVITGILYNNLVTLKSVIPLVSPQPANMDQWVETAINQNWQIIAARFTTQAAQDNIEVARGGHIPTLDLSANYENNYTRTFQGGGRSRVKGPSAGLELTVPLFEGGSVSSQVRQAIANYESASEQQEKSYRDVLNTTRQSYLGVMSGIKTVQADKQAIISNISSLEGMQEGYKVGTRTMVDVLDAEKTLYESQKNYARDRYSYIMSIIQLKQAAGTLNVNDLQTINTWLQQASDLLPKGAYVPKKISQKTKTIKPKKTTVVKKTAITNNYYYVQVGAYHNEDYAKDMLGRVQGISNYASKIYEMTGTKGKLHIVKIGPISTKQSATSVIKQLNHAGIKNPVIVNH